jgi:hypothetical protein
MPRPVYSKEIKKEVPFKVLKTDTREDAREDASGKVEHTVPITHHYYSQKGT